MIYLHKILPIFILPVMIVIQLICIGLIKKKNKYIYFALVLLYVISTPFFSNNFFKLVEGSEYRTPINKIDNAEAIVVLSGMLSVNEVGNSYYIEWGDPDRFFGGIDLMKAGKASKLIFTGGKMPWSKSTKNEGEILKEHAILNGIIEKQIIVTKDVQNTEQEAVAVKELIKSNESIILVTSAFHMLRAKRLFEKQGINVIPYKVDYKSHGNGLTTIIDFLPNANSLARTENGFRELLGRLFYFLIKP